MEIDVSNIHFRKCKKCDSELMWTETVGCNITMRCMVCSTFNGNLSKEDAGIKERTNTSVRHSIPERTKNLVRTRAGCKCELCGKLAADSPLHISHLVSIYDGLRFGIPTSTLNSDENLAMMCEECNVDMGNETVPLRLAVTILAIRTRRTTRNFQQIIDSTNQ